MKRYLFPLLALLALSACGGRREAVDPLKKAQVDALCKEAFINRYKDPTYSVAVADSALTLLADSVPAYSEGLARTYNTRAFCSYLISQHSDPLPEASTPDIERTLSQLLEARWAQRLCETAESYRILSDIERSGVLQRNQDNYLYAYAQSEYYITQLLLNYHYRNGSLIDGARLLNEIEACRNSLRVDYAQDMALNYAMAHSYLRLADEADTALQASYIGRSLALLQENLYILASPQNYCEYEMANVLQMMAFTLYDTALAAVHWERLWPQWDTLYLTLEQRFGFVLDPSEESALALFQVSTDLFLQLDDPYQRLGACVATADYALATGDTALAHHYLSLALADTAATYGFAPKMELGFYELLIRSLFPGTRADYGLWFDRVGELHTLIAQNQSADFQLQLELEQARQASHRILLATIVVSLLTLALIVALLLLRRRTRALAHEKHLLEEAKKADVERIASVETCLSVLRHDITPFISYLQNPRLPEPLRAEVVGQLARTFDNIKSWTTLSAPSGLKFHVEHVALSELFAEVQGQVVNLHPEAVQLRFHPSPLALQGDRQLLVILLRNLLTNALQHTCQGLVEVQAQMSSEDSRFVKLTVSDTGDGMTSEALEELFRSNKRPNESGHGFGLILCRHIVKQHDDHTLCGCRIWAESTPGHGTQFHLLLPASTPAHTPILGE